MIESKCVKISYKVRYAHAPTGLVGEEKDIFLAPSPLIELLI